MTVERKIRVLKVFFKRRYKLLKYFSRYRMGQLFRNFQFVTPDYYKDILAKYGNTNLVDEYLKIGESKTENSNP